MLKLSCHIFFLSLFIIPVGFSYGASDGAYTDLLVKKALDEEIYKERNWEVLLHYKKTAFKPLHSLVDDPKFFLSEKGQKDPAAELEATIRGLFDDTLAVSDDDHPFCRYPARKEWLIKRLDIDGSKLPQKNCAKFEEVKEKLDPKSVTLVFPFIYINRPASMFGHTLLRINNGYNDPLLAYGVTFSAEFPEGGNKFVYSVKGLFGGLKGHYEVKKYYETLFEYSNVDKRDIWEYDLNLTEAESKTLFYHLWELADVYSYYWFFDENCSYNLLFLIEAARPDLMLTTSIFWEAPSETVKKAFKNKLVKDVVYRPSHIKSIENIGRLMPSKTITLGTEAGNDRIKAWDISATDYSDKLKVAMLDLAIETMRYNYIGKPVTKDGFERYKEQSIELLSERAKYRIKSDYKLNRPVSPHLGHDITSVTVGVGVTRNTQFFTTVGFRLGFHSLTDFDDGYIPNTQTVVADVNLKWNTASGEVYVEDATFISVGAYAPMTKIFKPVSWKIDFAAQTKDFLDGKKFVPYLNGAVGITGKFFDSLYLWFLADLNLSFSDGYKNVLGLGLGGHGGASYGFKWGKIIVEGYYRNYVINDFGHETGVSAYYVFPVTRNNALTAKYERKMSWDVYATNISLSWRFYF